MFVKCCHHLCLFFLLFAREIWGRMDKRRGGARCKLVPGNRGRPFHFAGCLKSEGGRQSPLITRAFPILDAHPMPSGDGEPNSFFPTAASTGSTRACSSSISLSSKPPRRCARRIGGPATTWMLPRRSRCTPLLHLTAPPPPSRRPDQPLSRCPCSLFREPERRTCTKSPLPTLNSDGCRSSATTGAVKMGLGWAAPFKRSRICRRPRTLALQSRG
jgi:hypothetical protein